VHLLLHVSTVDCVFDSCLYRSITATKEIVWMQAQCKVLIVTARFGEFVEHRLHSFVSFEIISLFFGHM
jgi:hypothetical protein